MFKTILNMPQRRAVSALKAVVARVESYAPRFSGMSDAELQACFVEFHLKASAGSDLEVAEVFSAVREAAFRVLKLTPFHEQLMAGAALASNRVAEMATGEGKTIAAVFAVVMTALSGKQVHVATANEYLAQRDATYLAPLYRFMGLSVAVSLAAQASVVKLNVYQRDVIYSTLPNFATDYLVDQLARHPRDVFQKRGRHFLLVDEADAVLIDEARVPVVLKNGLPTLVEDYALADQVASTLVRADAKGASGDFWLDGDTRTALLTEQGYDVVNAALIAAGLLSADESSHYSLEHARMLQRITTALEAKFFFLRGRHYLVSPTSGIVLLHELTGRSMPGHSFPDGLQQALEVKEGVSLSPESMVLGRISLQAYAQLYPCLAGMSGTAVQVAEELTNVYGLRVVKIPRRLPSHRKDAAPRYFRNVTTKLAGLVEDVKVRHAAGQPVLIGTATVDQSQLVADALKAAGVPHEVLNASNHDREAAIMAQAGMPNAVTVATIMAGRGVDIVLGGNADVTLHEMWQSMGEERWNAHTAAEQHEIVKTIRASHAAGLAQVRAAGGLHVIGFEHFETARMDAQLRGRSGRQGDVGSSCIYYSLEDTLMEFAGEQVRKMLATLGILPGDEAAGAFVLKAISALQRQAEGRAADARKQIVQFDGIVRDQREAYFSLRSSVLYNESMHAWSCTLRREYGHELVMRCAPEAEPPEHWRIAELRSTLEALEVSIQETDAQLRALETVELVALVARYMERRHQKAAGQVAGELVDVAERVVVLGAMDGCWFRHQAAIEEVRRGAGLRGYVTAHPLLSFQRDAFAMFERFFEELRFESLRAAMTWGARGQDQVETLAEPASPGATSTTSD